MSDINLVPPPSASLTAFDSARENRLVQIIEAQDRRDAATMGRVDQMAEQLKDLHELNKSVLEDMRATMEIAQQFLGTIDELSDKLMEATAALVLLRNQSQNGQ